MRLARRLTTCAAAALGALALLALPGAAAAKDRNHDRIPDRWERHHHLSTAVNQAQRDQDGDQLRNRAEFLAGDNPRNADSDGDGVPDGEENAGKIASFDATTGTLTIDLFGGATLTGLVDEETEIECSNSGSASASDSQQGQQESGDDNGGDSSGPGNSGVPCSSADLTPGATVHEAELQLENGAATFEKVELGG